MKKNLKIGLLLFTLPLCFSCNNNFNSSSTTDDNLTYNYGEKEMYQKIWDSDVIYNESIVLIEDENGVISGTFLYEPTNIIAVKDATLTKNYNEDEYRIEGNKIYPTENSTMPFLTQKNIKCEEVPELIGSTYDDGKGGKILFTEGPGIFMYQISATYTHNHQWHGTIPLKQGSKLTNLQNKLQNKENIRLVVNGDSIFTGANASSKFGMEPYQDTFPDGFAKEIERVYGSKVEVINTAVGGQVSSWGKQNVEANIIQYNPDLVLIGFGMNDGSWNVPASDYVDNIDFMVRAIQTNCPNADIIVAATIVANPDSAQYKSQPSYLQPLLDMASTYNGVTILDMTTFSLDLLKIKNSFELYANNINHPCDFMVRQYVANLMNLIEE